MSNIPKRIFIIPYKNRVEQKFFFTKYMSFLLEDLQDYELYFSHQTDNRTFNRGATKNIGFLAMKNKYPNNYKDITFIFNDLDTVPFNKIFDYETSHNIVKHYYGYKYTLGGIVVIKGSDFERINGYPCFWGWGLEDNCLQKRCENFNIVVDRSQFYPIGSPKILQLFDGMGRIISKKDPWRMDKDDGIDGLKTIYNLKYTINNTSSSQTDNEYKLENSHFFYINIENFQTFLSFEKDQYFNYDLREPKRPIIHPNKIDRKYNFYPSNNSNNNSNYNLVQKSLFNFRLKG